MAELTEAMLQRLIDAQEKVAASNVTLASAVHESTAAAAARQEAIMESLLAVHSGRVTAVDEIKRHITEDVNRRETWWRNSFKLWAGAMVLATLLGVPVGRLISALIGLK